MKQAIKAGKTTTRRLALFSTIALCFAVLMTVLDVILRSVSESTLPGMVDMVQLCIMMMAMLSIPYGFYSGAHISVDLFTRNVSPLGARLLQALSAILGTLFLGFVAYFAFHQAIMEYGYGDGSQTIGIPMILYWVPLLLGIGLSVLANVAAVLGALFGTAPGEQQGNRVWN